MVGATRLTRPAVGCSRRPTVWPCWAEARLGTSDTIPTQKPLTRRGPSEVSPRVPRDSLPDQLRASATSRPGRRTVAGGASAPFGRHGRNLALSPPRTAASLWREPVRSLRPPAPTPISGRAVRPSSLRAAVVWSLRLRRGRRPPAPTAIPGPSLRLPSVPAPPPAAPPLEGSAVIGASLLPDPPTADASGCRSPGRSLPTLRPVTGTPPLGPARTHGPTPVLRSARPLS